jgi:hypothetical protein
MWLYLPSTSSPSALADMDSISESSWQCRVLEASCVSKGKHTPSRTWSQRCKKVSFLKLLFGAMCHPSMADRGVVLWMASLAASRASRIQSPATVSQMKTSAIFGPLRAGSSSKRARGSSSSRTSAASSRPAVWNASGEMFVALVTSLRQDYSLRQKSARAIVAKGVSFSVWPTPTARDWKGTNGEAHMENGSGRLHLDQLPNFVEHLWYLKPSNDNLPPHLRSSLPAPASETNGIASSQPRRMLNPLFVEWLMGLPPRWTLAAWPAFACSATELSHWKRRMRSALWQLDSPADPVVQNSLFG